MTGLPPLPTDLRIFPSRLAIDRTLRLEVGQCTSTAAAVTFGSLLKALGSLEGSRYASPLVGRIVLRTLMLRGGGRLAAVARDAYAVRAVQRGLMELRMAGITAKHFDGVQRSTDLDELVSLLAGYERRLEEHRLADDADRERQGVYAVTQGRMPAELSRVKRVTVEGGATLFGARLDLLAALAAAGVDVTVRVPYDTDRAGAFGWPEAGLHGLETRGLSDIVPVLDPRHGEGPLGALRQAQFTEQTVATAPVRVLHAPSQAEHARGIAAQVRHWLQRGVPADEIAIGVADLPALGSLIMAELEAAEVPAYTRRGPSLRATDAGRALDQALQLPDAGFPREPLLEVWRTLGRRLDSAAGPLAPDLVAAEVRRAGSRSARLLAFREALEARAARQARRSDKPAQRSRAIADALDELMEVTQALPDEAPLDEHVTALEVMFGKLQLSLPGFYVAGDDPDGAMHGGRQLLRAQAHRHNSADAVGGLLTELRHAALTAPDGAPWTRAELSGLLTLLLGERALPPAAVRSGSVAVIGIDELVETRFSRVLLAGIDADVFPRAAPVDLVLTSDVRAEVNRLLGPRLLQFGATTGRDALRADARDTWHWLEALAAAQDELVVTFGTADTDEAGIRSELVDELLRSLDNPVIEPMIPSYAGESAASVHQVVQAWSLAGLGRGGRIAGSMSPGAVLALDPALRELCGGRLEAVERRVSIERQIRGEARRAAPLAKAEQAWLEEYFFDTMQSSSRLDTLGKCAFMHFARHLLRLEADELPALGADAREEGSAAHAALQFIYVDIKEQGGLAVARRDPDDTRRRAREVFDAHADRILEEVMVHPALRPAVLEEAWSTAAAQLDRDLASDEALEPAALEWGFDDRDGGDSGPLELREPDGKRTIRVRGKIDRIDVGATEVLTIDYKRSRQDRVAGRHFQLAIYGLVGLRDFLPEASHVRTAWIALRAGKIQVPKELETEPAAFERQLHEDLWPHVYRALDGDISPDPDKPKSCARCEYKRLCRYDVQLDPTREGAE